MKIMLIILLCGFLKTQFVFPMHHRNPEQEKKKIEQMAKKSVEEKRSWWINFLNKIIPVHYDPNPYVVYQIDNQINHHKN